MQKNFVRFVQKFAEFLKLAFYLLISVKFTEICWNTVKLHIIAGSLLIFGLVKEIYLYQEIKEKF